MASINSDDGIISGVSGLKYSADSSGTLVLQTNGTTAISISAAQAVTFAGAVSLGALTTSGNLTFTGTGNRITGDFSNATQANRVAFQTSTTNANTSVNAIPNGTGTTSQFIAYAGTDMDNSSRAGFNTSTTLAMLFADKTGTGTYLPMTFLTGGSERLRIDTSGNVGIGTSSPATKLNISGTGGVYFRIDSTTNSGVLNYVGANLISALTDAQTVFAGGLTTDGAVSAKNNLLFGTASAERMRIDSSGNVGIGTTTPAYKLDVQGTVGAIRVQPSTGTNSAYSVYQNTGNILYVGVDNSAGTDFGAAYSASLTTTGAYPLTFRVNNAERMRIDSSGNVCIGGTTADQTFNVVGKRSWFASNSSPYSIKLAYNTVSSGFWLGSPESNALAFSNDAGTERMRIDSSGNVGINGTPSAWGRKALQVTDATQGYFASNTRTGIACNYYYDGSVGKYMQNGYAALYENNSTAGTHLWYTAPSGTAGGTVTLAESMRIDSSGNLLIGTASYGGKATLQSVADQVSLQINNYYNSQTRPSIQTSSYTAASIGWYHFVGQSGNGSSVTANNVFIYGNGNMANTNNVYGAMSDAALKENIVDVSPKLSSLMQVKVRNYNLIADETKTKQIGVIAQELEEVFPSMIEIDGMSGHKQVKYSVFVPMLIKAIQEQQVMIAELKAEVAALKG